MRTSRVLSKVLEFVVGSAAVLLRNLSALLASCWRFESSGVLSLVDR